MIEYCRMLLDKLGLSWEYAIVFLVVINGLLLLWNFYNQITLIQVKKKYRQLLRGTTTENLEEILLNRIQNFDQVEGFLQENKERMEHLENEMKAVFCKSGFLRYDALDTMAGKLSSAFALLDKEDNGYLFNIIYGRNESHTYMKEIKKGACDIHLSEEEQEALALALKEK